MTKKQVIKVNDRHEFIAVRDWYKTQGRTFERPEMAGNKYPTLIIEADTDKLKQRPISAAGSYEVIEFEAFKEANGIEVIVKPKKPMHSTNDIYPYLNVALVVNNFTTLEIPTPELRNKFKAKSKSTLPETQLKQVENGVKEFLKQAGEIANKSQ